jgi:2-isopropylmalate synthase
VLVDTTDGTASWTTVGVHANVVEASWLALLDAMIYAALRHHGVATSSLPS